MLSSLNQSCTQCSSPTSNENTISVLFQTKNAPFWIQVPKALVTNKSFKINQNYYFLFNLLKGNKGAPFAVQENFVSLELNKNNISLFLLLDIHKYLKKSNTYWNQSISNTSLYYLYGYIKQIRW